jgi:hypothetical protein
MIISRLTSSITIHNHNHHNHYHHVTSFLSRSLSSLSFYQLKQRNDIQSLPRKNNISIIVPPSYRNIATSNSTSQSQSKVVSCIKPILEKHVFTGASINIGGFGLGGIPETLIHEVEMNEKATNLTIASLTAGVDGFGLGKLFEKEGKVKRILASYVGENKVCRSSIYIYYFFLFHFIS